MNPQPKLIRSKTSKKQVVIKLESYKPRDWGYQNIKHQIKPKFVLGRYKKKFPASKEKITTKDEFGKRQLKSTINNRFTLSQIYTLPGAVRVEENKIKDDEYIEKRIHVNKINNFCYLNKLRNEYSSNVPFLPGSKDVEIKKEKFLRGKSCSNFRIKKENEKNNTNNNNLDKKALSPNKTRIKRNKNK